MSNGLNVLVSGTPTKEEQKIIETFKKEDEVGYRHEIANLDELLLQLDYVHKKLRHYLHTSATKYKNEFFMTAPVFTRYQDTIMQFLQRMELVERLSYKVLQRR